MGVSWDGGKKVTKKERGGRERGKKKRRKETERGVARMGGEGLKSQPQMDRKN